MSLKEIQIEIATQAQEALVYFIQEELKLEKVAVEDALKGSILVKIYLIDQNEEQIKEKLQAFIKELPSFGLEIGKVQISIQQLQDEDWLYKWREFFKPIDIEGSLIVRPPWEQEVKGFPNLIVHPKMGFGTGQHPTTFLCLKHILEEDLKNKSVLDLGAGSGILGTAALMFGASKADLVEIDDMAIESCEETLKLNAVDQKARVFCKDILKDQKDIENQNYDIAFINIIAEVIVKILDLELIKDIPVIYLSGIIKEKRALVENVIKSINYNIVYEENLGEWLFFKIKRGY